VVAALVSVIYCASREDLLSYTPTYTWNVSIEFSQFHST